MYIKKLIGKKCYLAPMRIEDAEKYAVWANDQEVSEYLNFASSSISLEAERIILDRISKEHNYAIVDSETDELIGSMGLMSINHINRTAELGIFIGNKAYWSKGYGTEAMCLLINYAYQKLNLHNIILNVYSYNERAIKAYEKVGFKKIGARRGALIRNRKMHDIILMDIIPEDFYAKHPEFEIV